MDHDKHLANLGASSRPMPGRTYHTAKLVDHRSILFAGVVLISMALIPLVLNVRLDRTLKSAYVTSSPAYSVYKDFVELFGDDEFIIVAIKSPSGIRSSDLLKALSSITSDLQGFEEIATVLSLGNLKFFQERKGVFRNYPVLETTDNELKLPDEHSLQSIKTALPLMDYLVSTDKNTVGILIKLKEDWRFHPQLGDLQDRMKQLVSDKLPKGSEFRMTGASVIREEVQGLTITTAVRYGILCTLVVGLMCWYIFKSFRAAAIALLVIGVGIEWVLGFMSAANIPLNSTTSLSFGLIMIVSVSNVIHIMSHYYQAAGAGLEKTEATKTALRIIGRPCLMCSLTTSVAFATIMISSIPMVRQLGLIMSLGVLISFVLAMILTPAFLMAFKTVDQSTKSKMTDDSVNRVFRGLEHFVFKRYRLCLVASILFTLAMIAGTPFIKTDTQILHLFVDSSRVISDVKFVEKNLAPIRSLELVVEAPEQFFKQGEAWEKVAQLEKSLLVLPDVDSLDSPLPLLEYLNQLTSKGQKSSEALFKESRLVSQLFTVISLSTDGKELLRRYLSPLFDRIHISVRIKDTSDTPMSRIIQSVESTARDVMKTDKVIVTGEQAVFAAQASEVVNSQVQSLVLAFIGVTILLIIQLRSISLGLISLIPNILPVAVIFGMMGWLRIPLDNVTVFAAAIAIGLSVDDTIHYLTQLKREMTLSTDPDTNVVDCMRQSYQKTARAMIATSITLFLGLLMLSVTPTKPAIYFGFLGGAAVMVALLADLIVLQSFILTLKPIRNIMNREIRILGPDDTAPVSTH